MENSKGQKTGRILTLFVAALLSACLSFSSLAQPSDARSFTLGAFGGYRESEYRGVGEEWLAVPFVQARLGGLSFQGRGVSYAFPSSGLISFESSLDYFSGGYESSESSFLSRMAERHSSVHLGAAVNIRLPSRLKLKLGLNHDILGRSEGYVGEVTLSRFFFLGPAFQFILSGSFKHYSKNLVDYYYGVGPDEVADQRPAYAGSADWSPSAQVLLFYNFAERWQLFGLVSRTWQSGAVEKSPLTIDEERTFYGLGLGIKF